MRMAIKIAVLLTISSTVDESSTEQESEAVKKAEAERCWRVNRAHNCDAIVH